MIHQLVMDKHRSPEQLLAGTRRRCLLASLVTLLLDPPGYSRPESVTQTPSTWREPTGAYGTRKVTLHHSAVLRARALPLLDDEHQTMKVPHFSVEGHINYGQTAKAADQHLQAAAKPRKAGCRITETRSVRPMCLQPGSKMLQDRCGHDTLCSARTVSSPEPSQHNQATGLSPGKGKI